MSVRRVAKLPKGTIDSTPYDMAIRKKVLDIIIPCYEKHGAVTIDTPDFELKESLLGNYGEDQKLVYDLVDQGGELLSLRYDLTVPLARYVATHNINKIKRYHIAKVHRRDNPSLERGRLREFTQCDFDIVGNYDSMLPEAECLLIVSDILTKLNIGTYTIHVNHRKLLNKILQICSIPEDQQKTVCSSIDKLDKLPWSDVATELIDTKHIDSSSVDMLHEFMLLTGTISEVIESDIIKAHYATLKDEIDQLLLLTKYTDALDVTQYLNINLSLARGLDYYTGIIFEATLVNTVDSYGNTNNNINVGSICGGGRYDELIGQFSNSSIPAIGFSLGLERLFTIYKQLYGDSIKSVSTTKVLVTALGNLDNQYRLSVCKQLWDANVPCEFLYYDNAKMKQAIEYAINNNIPYMLVLAENELKDNKVIIQNIENKQKTVLSLDDYLVYIKNLFNI